MIKVFLLQPKEWMYCSGRVYSPKQVYLGYMGKNGLVLEYGGERHPFNELYLDGGKRNGLENFTVLEERAVKNKKELREYLNEEG